MCMGVREKENKRSIQRIAWVGERKRTKEGYREEKKKEDLAKQVKWGNENHKKRDNERSD